MTLFSKILLVLVLFASIAFMGFTAVSSVGGPNWYREKDAMTDYLFEYQPGENPIWAVKTRRAGEQISTSPVLAKVIVAAQKHKIQQQNEKFSGICRKKGVVCRIRPVLAPIPPCRGERQHRRKFPRQVPGRERR